MAKTDSTPNITMYLKYMSNDLYYCMNDPNGTYQPLQEDTLIVASPGWVVQWECADSSIEKINNINVNQNKGGGKNYGNVWQTKPAKANSSGTIFQGTILSGSPTPPVYDGYTIKYKTSSGDKEKDPEIRYPA